MLCPTFCKAIFETHFRTYKMFKANRTWVVLDCNPSDYLFIRICIFPIG